MTTAVLSKAAERGQNNKMKRKIRDILPVRPQDQPRAISPELKKIIRCLIDNGPIVVWIHGQNGTEKSVSFANIRTR
jgi:hypothetical protein